MVYGQEIGVSVTLAKAPSLSGIFSKVAVKLQFYWSCHDLGYSNWYFFAGIPLNRFSGNFEHILVFWESYMEVLTIKFKDSRSIDWSLHDENIILKSLIFVKTYLWIHNCVQYTRIWLFSDPYFPLIRENVGQRKTCILAHFTQWMVHKKRKFKEIVANFFFIGQMYFLFNCKHMNYMTKI